MPLISYWVNKNHCYGFQSTLTIDKHSVSTTNIEELANHMDPQLAPRIIIPPTNVDFFEGKPFQLRAVVAGIPKPQIRWYKSKMILDSNTRKTIEQKTISYSKCAFQAFNCS